MKQREKFKYKEFKHDINLCSRYSASYVSHKGIWDLVFSHVPCSTAHGVQENQRPHLHGGVSQGIPKASPAPPHHTIVILALVLPFAVELPVQVGCMASVDRRLMSKMSHLPNDKLRWLNLCTFLKLLHLLWCTEVCLKQRTVSSAWPIWYSPWFNRRNKNQNVNQKFIFRNA